MSTTQMSEGLAHSTHEGRHTMAVEHALRGLRILSLDGGGIKGYSTLLILKRIMQSLQNQAGRQEVPLPCEVFDLIAGTSTGGLIAVMLGRLHMNIDECIRYYEIVGEAVFSTRPRFGDGGRLFKAISSSPFYDIKSLQDAIKKVLKDKHVAADTKFLETQAECKV